MKNSPPTMSISVTAEGPIRGDRVFGPIQHLSRMTEQYAN